MSETNVERRPLKTAWKAKDCAGTFMRKVEHGDKGYPHAENIGPLAQFRVANTRCDPSIQTCTDREKLTFLSKGQIEAGGLVVDQSGVQRVRLDSNDPDSFEQDVFEIAASQSNLALSALE